MKMIRSRLALALAGCAFGLSGAALAQDDLQQVNVMSAVDTSCSPYPQYVGQEFGYYEEEGLKVNLLSSETTVPFVAFLSNGQADLVMLDSAQVLQAVNAGQPIEVVYEAYQFAPEGIYVPADSDVQSVADLKGETIGLASDRDRITTAIALNAVGMTMDDVETVVVGEGGPTIVSSFDRGAIAAFAGSANDKGTLNAAGFAFREITPAEVNQNPGNSFAVWGPTLDEKRDMIEGFLRGWAKAQHAGVFDTQTVMAACKKRVPEQWEDEKVGEGIVRNSVYNTQLRRTHRIGELQPDVWARIQPPYVKVGVIDKEIDPETFLDDSFIEAANDFTTQEVKQGIAKFKAAQKAN